MEKISLEKTCNAVFINLVFKNIEHKQNIMEALTTKNQFLKVEKQAIYEKEKTKKEILRKYKTIDNFYGKLTFFQIDSPDSDQFLALYKFYASFFTLPDETETYDGFESTLRLNYDVNLHKLFGGFKESWLYVCYPKTDEIIAGINYSVYELDKTNLNKSEYAATGHVMYIFVKPMFRGLGLAKRLLVESENIAKCYLKENKSILWFCEQNAPEKMSPDEYFADNLNALIDQCDRLIWWDKIGFKRLDFDYIQPALNPGHEACTNLTLNVKVSDQKRIASYLVKSHLERFFLIAVYKGFKERIDIYYEKQMELLDAVTYIKLEGSVEYYKSLKSIFYK